MVPGLTLVAPVVAGGAALGALFTKARARLELSRAKHPSLAGHARWSRRIAALIPFYDYDDSRFFRCDGAPDDVAERRRNGFARLAQLYRERFPADRRAHRRKAGTASRTCSSPPAYRVPFQFSHTGAGVRSRPGRFCNRRRASR